MQVLGDNQMCRSVLDDLVERGLIDDREADLSFASEDSYNDILRRVSDEELAKSIANVTGDLYIEDPDSYLDEGVFSRFKDLLSKFDALALRLEDDSLLVGVISSLDSDYLNELERSLSDNYPDLVIQLGIVPSKKISGYFHRDISVDGGGKGAVKDLIHAVANDRGDAGGSSDNWRESLAGKLFLAIISEALQLGASDITIRARSDTESSIIYRINGDAEEYHVIKSSVDLRLCQTIKYAGRMDIGSSNTIPQDGSIKLTVSDTRLTLRANVLPSMYRERSVLRVIRSDVGSLLSLDKLGFLAHEKEEVEKGLMYPKGLVLVTGPTGSGKNTTLYSMLRHVYNPKRTYLSAENPIEGILDFMDQTEVSPQLSFADALRAMLRQDPDVIMITEMRDHETAEIASHAAMTGHLLFSTLHTNSAPETILRITEMGISALVASTITNLLVSQKLVKRLCEHCRVAQDASFDLLRRYVPSMNEEVVSSRGYDEGVLHTKSSTGCEHCKGSGYAGRTVVPEVVYIDREYKRMMLHSQLDEFEERMVMQNKDALHSAMVRVQQGLIGLESLSEVISRQ